MKKVLKGKHFADVEVVKQKTTEARKVIKIDELQNLGEWNKHLDRCSPSHGEYFEGN